MVSQRELAESAKDQVLPLSKLNLSSREDVELLGIEYARSRTWAEQRGVDTLEDHLDDSPGTPSDDVGVPIGATQQGIELV